MKTATEGQMTEGTVSGPRATESPGLQRERLIHSLTLGPTTQTAFVFLKYFQAIKALWGSFTSDHRGGPLEDALKTQEDPLLQILFSPIVIATKSK